MWNNECIKNRPATYISKNTWCSSNCKCIDNNGHHIKYSIYNRLIVQEKQEAEVASKNKQDDRLTYMDNMYKQESKIIL